MKTFHEFLKSKNEAVKAPRDVSEITPYHVRWMIRRDIPEVIELAKRHPDFSNMPNEDIEANITKLLSLREGIGQVAEDVGPVAEEESARIVGAMIYTLHDDHFQMPFIAAENSDVAYFLINKLKNKIPGTKRSMLYVKTHLGDPHVLGAMRDHGMVTKVVGDDVHAKYPVTNMQHKGVYDTYHSIVQGQQQEPGGEEEEGPDDPYGLFKGKPWKK